MISFSGTIGSNITIPLWIGENQKWCSIDVLPLALSIDWERPPKLPYPHLGKSIENYTRNSIPFGISIK
jgi:hypothetical protein